MGKETKGKYTHKATTKKRKKKRKICQLRSVCPLKERH